MHRIRTVLICLICVALSVSSAVSTAATDAKAKDGFADDVSAQVFSQRLRDVTDIVLLENGTVYALSGATGQVTELRDRRMDGRADGRKTLPGVFDRPSALALVEGRLYVADRRGIWGMGAAGPEFVASLSNTGSVGDFYLLAATTPGHIIVGWSRASGIALARVNLRTGAAEMLAEGDGELRALSRFPGGSVWTASALPDGRTAFGPELRVLGEPVAAKISDMVVVTAKEDWAKLLDGHIITVHDGDKLSALPLTFGRPALPGRPLMLGAQSKRRTDPGRVLRGLAADKRGIFVFDRKAKTLWVVKPELPKIAVPDPSVSPASLDDNSPDPSPSPRGAGQPAK